MKRPDVCFFSSAKSSLVALMFLPRSFASTTTHVEASISTRSPIPLARVLALFVLVLEYEEDDERDSSAEFRTIMNAPTPTQLAIKNTAPSAIPMITPTLDPERGGCTCCMPFCIIIGAPHRWHAYPKAVGWWHIAQFVH